MWFLSKGGELQFAGRDDFLPGSSCCFTWKMVMGQNRRPNGKTNVGHLEVSWNSGNPISSNLMGLSIFSLKWSTHGNWKPPFAGIAPASCGIHTFDPYPNITIFNHFRPWDTFPHVIPFFVAAIASNRPWIKIIDPRVSNICCIINQDILCSHITPVLLDLRYSSVLSVPFFGYPILSHPAAQDSPALTNWRGWMMINSEKKSCFRCFPSNTQIAKFDGLPFSYHRFWMIDDFYSLNFMFDNLWCS